jgi:mono/diheme cytochrome c family protein
MHTCRIGLALGALLTVTTALPADNPDYDSAAALRGGETFKTHCASCHGRTAHGDGPLADQLRFLPADLTTISKRNRGKFPAEKVQQIIDGRTAVKGHGGGDMPIWGDAFSDSREGYDERKVKAKIAELVQFIASLQQDSPNP